MKKPILILFCFFMLTVQSADTHSDEENLNFKATLQKIPLNKEVIKTLGIETKIVEEKADYETIKTTGQIEENPNSRFIVNSPVQGKVNSIFVNLGDNVGAGQSLIELESTEISKLQSDIKQYEAELELAKNNYAREELLYEKGISAKKDYESAKTQLATAEANLSSAQSSLMILTDLAVSAEQGTFAVKAPRGGTVVEKSVTVGQVLNRDQSIFTLIDLSNVWASGDIYERDQSKIMIGQKAFVTLDGSADKVFEGKITYVGSVVNKDTRTLPVKATLVNKEAVLKPGAFIQLLIHTNRMKQSILIPRTALLEIDKEGTDSKHEHVVYLKKKNFFVPKRIEVEPHDSNIVEVVSGLMTGDVIVTQGAYQLQYKTSEENHEDEHEHEAEHRHKHEGQQAVKKISLPSLPNLTGKINLPNLGLPQGINMLVVIITVVILLSLFIGILVQRIKTKNNLKG